MKDLKNSNWKSLYECVESRLVESIDFKTMDAESSWLLLKEAIHTASQQHIPVKKICCFSNLTTFIGAKNSVRKAENFVRQGETTDTVARRITSSF